MKNIISFIVCMTIMAFSANAQTLTWVKSFGGIATETANGIATDGNGNVIVVGYYLNQTDFDPGPGVSIDTSRGESDAYILKLNPAGELLWHVTMGGSWYEDALGVVVDQNDNIYVTGYFEFTVDFDPGPDTMNLTSGGKFLRLMC